MAKVSGNLTLPRRPQVPEELLNAEAVKGFREVDPQ